VIFARISSVWLSVIVAWAVLLVSVPLLLADEAENRHTSQQALAYDRAGEKVKAAKAYEELAKADPAKHVIVSHRLVRLYAQLCNTNKALQWAEVVMERNPDPQAYLAGVHGMLKNYDKAESILNKEISTTTKTRRRLTLHWQLADVCEKQGKQANADEALTKALGLAKGKPEEAAAERRLRKFREKHEKRVQQHED
jgi:tetratricopeptide (TPR) repeat protein